MLKHRGITFDDYVVENNGVWTQICTTCAEKHHIATARLSGGASNESICGVAGCENEANFYLDFFVRH